MKAYKTVLSTRFFQFRLVVNGKFSVCWSQLADLGATQSLIFLERTPVCFSQPQFGFYFCTVSAVVCVLNEAMIQVLR